MSFEDVTNVPFIISESKFKLLNSGSTKYSPSDRFPEKPKGNLNRQSLDLSADEGVMDLLTSAASKTKLSTASIKPGRSTRRALEVRTRSRADSLLSDGHTQLASAALLPLGTARSDNSAKTSGEEGAKIF